METVNIHEAKTHLSRLVERAARGESFIIAKAGKPMVKVVPIESSGPKVIRRFGFLKEEVSVPADFDDLARRDIETMFYGSVD